MSAANSEPVLPSSASVGSPGSETSDAEQSEDRGRSPAADSTVFDALRNLSEHATGQQELCLRLGRREREQFWRGVGAGVRLARDELERWIESGRVTVESKKPDERPDGANT